MDAAALGSQRWTHGIYPRLDLRGRRRRDVSSPARPLRGLALATGAKFPIEQASWRIDSDKGGSTLRCVLAHGGLSVSDCLLEAGELYLSIPFFPPSTISRKEGLLSIIAYRFGIRKERRLVGVFFAEGPLEDTK